MFILPTANYENHVLCNFCTYQNYSQTEFKQFLIGRTENLGLCGTVTGLIDFLINTGLYFLIGSAL